MFSGGILFSGGGKLLLGVAGFHTGFFCWGEGGDFSDSTDIVQNFYREKKESKNVII